MNTHLRFASLLILGFLVAACSTGNSPAAEFSAVTVGGAQLLRHYALDDAAANNSVLDSAGIADAQYVRHNDTNPPSLATPVNTADRSAIGQIGDAMTFDGSFDWVNLGESEADLNFAGAFTISGWFKTTDAHGALLSLRNLSVENPVVNLTVGHNALGNRDPGKLSLLVRGSRQEAVTSSVAFHDDQWHHFTAMRRSDNVIQLSVDGEFQAAARRFIEGPITTDLRALGVELRWEHVDFFVVTGDDRYFRGSLDDFAIWDQEITAAQTRALYNLGLRLGQNDSEFNFNYDAGQVLELFGAHESQSESAAVSRTNDVWTYATGLNQLTPAGTVEGDLFTSGATTYLLVSSADVGTGLAIPEPTTLTLATLGLIGFVARRRRQRVRGAL